METRCGRRSRAFLNGRGIRGRTCGKSLQVIHPDTGEYTSVSVWDPDSNAEVCWSCNKYGPLREDFLMRWDWLTDDTVVFDIRDTVVGSERLSREQGMFQFALSGGKIVKKGFAPGNYESDW